VAAASAAEGSDPGRTNSGCCAAATGSPTAGCIGCSGSGRPAKATGCSSSCAGPSFARTGPSGATDVSAESSNAGSATAGHRSRSRARDRPMRHNAFPPLRLSWCQVGMPPFSPMAERRSIRHRSFFAALMRRSFLYSARQVQGGIDQGDVRKRLREVAKESASPRVIFFSHKPDVVA
jgi:hypothetical protein